MNTVLPVNRTELNYNRPHYTQLTEKQKLYNKQEAFKTLFQITLEKVLSDGGLTNV